jgi:peptide-methionine (S)-S-oxide reductase
MIKSRLNAQKVVNFRPVIFSNRAGGKSFYQRTYDRLGKSVGLIIISLSTLGLYEVGMSAEKSQQSDSVATFAGGCFWCMEKPFDELDGVLSTTSGYTGGQKINPSYEEVSSGQTGHTEALQVSFDPKKISYEKLLEVFWRNIDPTMADRQFCDSGSQYRAEIFFHTPEQEKLARQSKASLEASKKFPKIFTQVSAASTFYPAEEYHQDYYKKNPIRYKLYRLNCGRDKRLKELWEPAKK